MTWPDFDSKDTFGGREVDERLLESVTEYVRTYGIVPPPRLLATWRLDCKEWKESSLSPDLAKGKESDELPPAVMALLDNAQITLTAPFPPFSRQSFEKKLGSYLDVLPRLVNQAVHAAVERSSATEIQSAADIDLVVLTGGHSKWYFVHEMIEGKRTGPSGERINLPTVQQDASFRVLQMDRPETTVADGLAYQGEPIRLQSTMVNDMWLQLTVGKTQLEQLHLIERYTLLPHEKSHKQAAKFSYTAGAANVPIQGTVIVGKSPINGVRYDICTSMPLGIFNKVLDFFLGTSDWTAEVTVKTTISSNQRVTMTVKVDYYGDSSSLEIQIGG